LFVCFFDIAIASGSGDSGKSTIVKQFRLNHNVEFTPDEKALFREILQQNVVKLVKDVCNFIRAQDETNQVKSNGVKLFLYLISIQLLTASLYGYQSFATLVASNDTLNSEKRVWSSSQFSFYFRDERIRLAITHNPQSFGSSAL
jgi:hypothetical protein